MSELGTVNSSVSTTTEKSRGTQPLLKLGIRLHRLLAWLGGIGLLIWGLSGLLHPLMTTFGAQQSVYAPPTQPIDLSQTQPIETILQAAGITSAITVQFVAGAEQTLLQITTQDMAPRRYFNPDNGAELIDHDPRQAEFLARHYLGDQVKGMEVEHIHLLTEFDLEYPWVNRQLPVYRVDFASDDHLTAYVHTDTSTLASVNNDFKRWAQTGFQWFHSWDWLPDTVVWLRVMVITLFVGAITSLALSGIVMLLRIRRKSRAPGLRGWHRFGAWALAPPMLMLSVSGLYHLWLAAIDPPTSQLRFANTMQLVDLQLPLNSNWHTLTEGLNVNRVSIVKAPDGQILYRLGLAGAQGAPFTADEIRTARFEGVPATGPALYLTATLGEVWLPGDQEMALQLGEHFTGHGRAALKTSSQVTRFGIDYDFRNKRIPVWRLDYGTPVNATYFVDTSTGVLVDVVEAHEQPERLSFALLHKWNFLMMIGRNVPNLVISGVVLLAIGLLAVPGLQMKRRRRTRMVQ